MKSLKVLKARYSFPEALDRAVEFRPPLVHSDQKLFTHYAEAAGRFDRIATGLQQLCRSHLDFDFTPPSVEGLGAQSAALPYQATKEEMDARLQAAIAALANSLDVPKLGRIEWMDDESCRFTYFEVERDRGLLRNSVRRVAHTHDLVKARMHRLPADEVAMPQRAAQIIQAIPEPLRPFTRVVTGLEVQREARLESQREELTWLGQALDGGKRGVVEFGHGVAGGAQAVAGRVEQLVTSDGFKHYAPRVAAGLGVAALGGAVVAGLVKAVAMAAAAVPIAVADPAVVIGELCLYGWEG